MLAPTSMLRPYSEKGSSRTEIIFAATWPAAAALGTSGSRTANSSPPKRAIVSVSRRASCRRGPDLVEEQVAVVVAERVVDLLEAVEVHEHHRDARAVALGGEDRLGGAVAEQRAVGQPGEVVVQRAVLVHDRVAAALVDRGERQGEQRDQQRVAAGDDDHDRAHAEQHRGRGGLEDEVAHEVGEHPLALGQRPRGAGEEVVGEEEGDRGGRVGADRDRGEVPVALEQLAADDRAPRGAGGGERERALRRR